MDGPQIEDLQGFLQACIDGQPEGWRALFQKYSPLLYHTLRLNGASHDVAEDLIGDVYVKLMENRRARLRNVTIATEPKLRSWLVTIARNLYLDHCRHHEHVRALAAAAGEHPAATAISSFGRESASKSLLSDIGRRDLVEKALAHLSIREQLVLKLTYYEEFKLREIAALVDEPMGTVASLLSRAREKVRKKMQEIDVLDRSIIGGAQ